MRKHPKYSDSQLFLKIFKFAIEIQKFLLFYRNTKISTSCTAKSRRVGEKWMWNSNSAAKKHRNWSYSSIVYFKKISVTQCYWLYIYWSPLYDRTLYIQDVWLYYFIIDKRWMYIARQNIRERWCFIKRRLSVKNTVKSPI